ncbi:MAG TPA: cytochrome P450 [Myxococcaceae bacterium]|nr:cytochrome P450 [Myxococcaceae bacterium]
MDPLPPGPAGKLLSSLRYLDDPYRYSAHCARRYGDLFTVPLLTGPVVVTGLPEGAQQVFRAPQETFGIWAEAQLIPVFGRDSIFVATGESHSRHRRAIVPALQKVGEMPEIIRRRVEALRAGEELDAARFALGISLEVITRTLLGTEEDEELEALAARYVHTSGSDPVLLALVFPALQRWPYPPWARFERLRRQFFGRLEEKIQRAREAPPEERSAFASMLRMLEGASLRDDLVTLLIAGHESTAHALAWALYCLHRHPESLEALRVELDTLPPDAGAEDITALPYLDAVCEETLRLHPVVVQVTRVLRKPLSLGGYELPEGVSVSPCAHLIHRRPELFPEPERFRPERFLERRFSPFEHLPFGGGGNRCPGASFAKAEMKLVLFHLLRRWELAPTYRGEIPARVRGLVMVPSRRISMRILERPAVKFDPR